jgi:pilus assembly protein Flp/PilA
VAQPLRLGHQWRGKSSRISSNRRLRRKTHCKGAVQLIREDSMFQLVNFVKTFARNEEGQDLLEYALLVALIALIAIGAVGMAGGSVSAIFTNIATQLGAAA